MTLLLKILVLILTFIVGFIPIMFKEKFFKLHDGRTKVHMRAVWVLIAAMALLAIFNGLIVYNDKKVSDDNDRKTGTILELAHTNVTLSADLVDLSKRNAELAEAEHDLITGGRLYCTFFPFNRTNEVFDLELAMRGSHRMGPSPVLRDVTVYITRPRESASHSPIDSPYRIRTWTRDNGRAATDELFFPTLHLDNRGFIHCKLDLTGFTSDSCLIEFFSANGSWVQALQFAKVNGEWTYAVTTMPCLSTRSFITPHQQVFGAFPTNLLMETKRIYPNGQMEPNQRIEAIVNPLRGSTQPHA